MIAVRPPLRGLTEVMEADCYKQVAPTELDTACATSGPDALEGRALVRSHGVGCGVRCERTGCFGGAGLSPLESGLGPNRRAARMKEILKSRGSQLAG